MAFVGDTYIFIDGCSLGIIDTDMNTGYIKTGSISAPTSHFDVCGDVLITCHEFDKCKRFDIKTYGIIKKYDALRVNAESIKILPNCKSFIVGYKKGKCYRVDVISGKILQKFPGNSFSVFSISVNPDGTRMMVCYSNREQYYWNLETGECLNMLGTQNSRVRFTILHPNNKQYITCGYDGKCKLVDLETEDILLRYTVREYHIDSAVILPERNMLICCDEYGFCRYWNIQTGDILFTCEVIPVGNAIILHPSGEYVVIDNKMVIDLDYDEYIEAVSEVLPREIAILVLGYHEADIYTDDYYEEDLSDSD